MADIFSSLAAGGVKGIGDAVTEVIQQFHASPEQKAQIQAVIDSNAEKIAELNQQLQIKQIDADTQEDTTAGENIRAMLMSPDSTVRRAAVATIWTGCLVVIFNYIVLQFVRIWQPNFQPFQLPVAFWTVWLCANLGFVGHAAVQNALSGQGGAMSFLGMKVESKGD